MHERFERSLEDLPAWCQKRQPWLRHAAAALVPIYVAIMLAAPGLCIAAASKTTGWIAWPLAAMAPLSFIASALTLSLPHQCYIVSGRMPVDLAMPAYFHRRMYGLCWTSLFYSGFIYHAVLSIPWLRYIVFRGFGYRGSMDFTIYPDTWIRDLPLLKFGRGAYLSNKATIGSNMIFKRNGQSCIEVGSVVIGEGAMIGHMSLIGPGASIDDYAVVGVIAAVGRRAHIGARAAVGDGAIVDNGALVAPEAIIKARCYVGMKVAVDKSAAMHPCDRVLRRQPFHSNVDI